MPRLAQPFRAVVLFSCSVLLSQALRTRRNNATETDEEARPPTGLLHSQRLQHHNASKLLHRTQMLRRANGSRAAVRAREVPVPTPAPPAPLPVPVPTPVPPAPLPVAGQGGDGQHQGTVGALAGTRAHHRRLPKSWRKALLAIGGGTGVTPVGDALHGNATHLRRGLEFRARSQTGAVLLLLMMSYFVTIGISLHILYKQTENDSEVTFYADPRYHAVAMASHEFSDFLFHFNQTPKHAFLRVSGLVPLEDDDDSSTSSSASDVAELEGTPHRVAFAFALDLSSWIARLPDGAPPGEASQAMEEGITREDLETIAYFLAYDNNDLASLRIQKETEWPGFQELVGHIQQRIRECGFEGIVTVSLDGTEVMSVHKNKAWANFLLNRATRAMAAVSIVGVPPYLLYMWWRCRTTTVRTRFRIDLPPEEYWPLIADKLGADGFHPTGGGAEEVELPSDDNEMGEVSV